MMFYMTKKETKEKFKKIPTITGEEALRRGLIDEMDMDIRPEDNPNRDNAAITKAWEKYEEEQKKKK